MMTNALSDKELALVDAYWRAANYLSVGQIYLYDNPQHDAGQDGPGPGGRSRAHRAAAFFGVKPIRT
jgi:hypothetical protein